MKILKENTKLREKFAKLEQFLDEMNITIIQTPYYGLVVQDRSIEDEENQYWRPYLIDDPQYVCDEFPCSTEFRYELVNQFGVSIDQTTSYE